MNPPKVMIGIVTYDGKDYIWDEFIANVRKLNYPNVDIVVVDNTATKKYYSKLKRSLTQPNERVIHVQRGLNSREAQSKSLNKLREVFLKGDYEYFMSIESDLIPPVDIIERLMSHGKPVVGAMYLIGHTWSETQPPRPCLFATKPNKEGTGHDTYNIPAHEGWHYFGTGLRLVHGCGIGCTLMRRNILENFKFWWTMEGNVPKHSDVLFYMDLNNRRIQIYVDADIYIPHFRSNWDDVKDI